MYDPGESTSGEITDISEVVVGQSKRNVDSVDSDLVIMVWCLSVFGRFIKYGVGQAGAVGH